ANADELDAGGARRTAALEQWVRGGGKLVVCTPSEPARLAALARLLPVELVDPKNPAARLEVRETEQPEPLRSIVRSYLERTTTVWREARPVLDTPTWDTLKGPFQFARATPKPRAVADDDFPIYWDDQGKDRTPFVVRWPYGLGSVTWVATNLGDGRLTGRTVGWSAIWTEVMGWNLVPLPGTRGQEIERQASFPYGSGARKLDLGASLLSSVEHGGKQATLVSLVVVFFIVYWLAAGPGSYLLLANKGRKNASWPAFALAAMVATGLTVLVTRLVLQGDPVARHWTLVQQAPGQPAVVTSRVGLYVPASTYQTVGLANAAEGVTSYVAPWPRNFHFNRDDDDAPPAQDYVVPVPDPAEAGGDEAAAAVEPVSFPYRSTNKVLAARWAGDAAGLLGGQPTFGGTSLSGIAGTMTNTAGRDLADVYFAFRNERGDVWLLYTPLWKNGQAIDLATAFHPGAAKRVGLTGGDAEGTPGGRDNLFGRIWSPGREQEDWLNYWYAGIRNEQDVQYKDERDGFRRSFPMLSFFDLLAPVRTAQNDRNRVELLRRGGRQFDLSHAVTAGQMVVIGRTDATAPLPVPLVVEGSPPAGQGTTFYQWVVPLDRPKPVATTQENVEVRMPNVE
ncbi:MAG TPA: hypothetical protein VK324_09790, partial [Tepidisphaeraceae bacterium]|nr:hypothetical protein [Tepidisphaeraceae bacterium]